MSMSADKPSRAEIKSVSDEEAAGLSDSSSAEVQVGTVLNTGNRNNSNNNEKGQSRIVPDFDQPQVAPSPAPVPIQGGDDEIIRVSHVRKIKVNAREPPVSKSTKPASVVGPNAAELPTPQRDSSSVLVESHLKNSLNKETMAKKRLIDDADDDEESALSDDCEPMDVIEKSPYELNGDAEKGVELFAHMKQVLKERKNDDDYRTVHEEATKIFGPSNAWCLVKANALIEKSGMVYSQEWCTGNIRGNQIGKMPKELLLLCLVSKRFAKAQDLLLSGLTRDFEVSSIVNEAIQAWKLSGDYQKTLGVHKNYQFTTRRRDCYKSAIFVARAYSCYKAFGSQGKLDPALMTKVKACLDMMEAHLPELTTSSKKKRKSENSSSASVDVPSVVATDTSNLPKRKRGRPRKNSVKGVKEEPIDNASQDDSLMDDESGILSNSAKPAKQKSRKRSSGAPKMPSMEEPDDLEMDDNDLIPYNPPLRKSSGKKSNAVATTAAASNTVAVSSHVAPGKKNGSKNPTSSLNKLISRFEKKYEEMGRVYQEMGQTLFELKAKVQENRTATEEEIRNELLLEVQENLLKSFGKGN